MICSKCTYGYEIIAQIFARFIAITNDLNALGKSYTSTELVKNANFHGFVLYTTLGFLSSGKPRVVIS